MQISFIMDVDSIDTAEVSPPKTNGKTSPSSATEPESTPTPKSVPESEPSKASKPTQESEPSPTTKPSSESEPSKGSKPSLESESSPTPKPLPTPEPASESEPSKGSKPSQESESSPASKPSPEPPKSKPSSKSEPPTKGSKLVARKSTTAAPKQTPTPPPTNEGEGSAPKKVHSVARKSTTTVARTTTTPSSNAAPSSKSASPPSSKSASTHSSKSTSSPSSKSASTPSSKSASGPLSKTVAITESPKVARKSTTTTSLKRPRPAEGPSSSNSSITIVPAPKVARKSTTSTPKTKKPGPKSKSMAEKRDSSSSTNKSHGRSKSPVRVDIKTTLSDSDLSPAASDAEDKPHKAGPKSKKFKLASILPKSKKGEATKTEKSSPAKTETPTKTSRKGLPKIRKIALTTPTSATRRDGQTYPILREGSTEFDRFYDLPDEWVKKLSQRQDGASKGSWDAYLYPPKRFKHKQLRSAMELMKFVMKNPDCELDPYYVNMDKNPNTIMDGNENPTPTTLRLLELVRRVKSNEEVNIEDFLNVKEKNKSKNKTKELQENFVVKEKKKMKGPRGRPKKSGPTPLELEMNLPKINMTEGIKLEKIFHQCTSKPSKHELKSYARDLDLKYRDVKKWFNIKWAAKEKYNAETVTTTQDESDDDEDLISRPRQVQRFDVLMSDDDPLDEPSVDDEPSAFDNSSVVIENGEQDNDELITGDETKTDDVELIVGDSNKTDDAELIIADDNKSEEDEDDEAIEIDAEVFI